MSQAETFSISAEIPNLTQVMSWLQNQLAQTPLSPEDQRAFQIAVEEAFVNIVHYAFEDQGGTVEFTFRFFPDDRIELQLIDEGIPFNLLEKKVEVDTESPMEERKEGGLGIPLIQRLIDDIQYDRDEGKNRLTFVCRLRKLES